MEIALNDLNVALDKALSTGRTDAVTLAGFVWGYLSAGPLDEDKAVAEAAPRWHVGEKIENAQYLNELPFGSEVTDISGDYYVKFSGGWAWYKWSSGNPRLNDPEDYYDSIDTLVDYFPATITKVGA